MVKPFLSKLNFLLGRNPKIEEDNLIRKFVPEDFKAVLLIDADFELAWAWQYSKSFINPVSEAKNLAIRERENIPEILDLCVKYNIPVTWATVGHLFLEACTCVKNRAHIELPRLSNFENKYWVFSGSDWFENDPCSDYIHEPCWYAPDLIRMILASNVKHEIGCHTFSHIDCRDEICPHELLAAELKECKKLANRFGLELKSFVHPGHTIGNLDILKEEGFTNFRTDYNNILGFPFRHKNGLWEFKQTTEIVYRKEWSIDYHIYRYITIVRRAIKNNAVCVLWFHPSFNPVIVKKILPEVFRFIDENRDKIWVTTHSEYVEWLEGKE